MNQDEVLALFIEEAEQPSRALVRQHDSILLLAKVVAESRAQLSMESFDALIHIGGTIYKTWDMQARARSEVTTIMKDSIDPN